MIKKILIALVAVVVVAVIVVATRPAAFRIERTATIHAPADLVYANLVDFHAWPAWSPWAKLDPNMAITYEGPASGVGASYAWKGNDKVGEGKMTIKEAKPSERIAIQLEFKAPMQATNLTEFSLKPAPGAVSVDWVMSGENGFVGKAFSMVMDMDKMVGKDFEKGLSDLKVVSEAEAAKRAEGMKAAAAAATAAPAPATPPAATAAAGKPAPAAKPH